MDVDVGTLVLASVFIGSQVLQTIQIAVLGRDVRRTLRPPPAFKAAMRRFAADDDEKTTPRGKR